MEVNGLSDCAVLWYIEFGRHGAVRFTKAGILMPFIKGVRNGADRTEFALMNTDAVEGAADVRLYLSEDSRDMHLAELRAGDPWHGDYISERRGGYWNTPIVWEPEERHPEDDTGAIAAEFPGVRDDAANAKLRELVRERNQLRRDVVTRETEHAAERTRLREELAAARAVIVDVNDPRLQPVWDRAAEAATENGFCAEYDKLCESLGIPGRERLYRGVVTIEIDAYVYATARNHDDASDRMEEQLRSRVIEALPQERYGALTDGSITNVDVRELSSEDVDIY